MEDEYERVLLVKNEIFIFKIPPRTTNRALRASDWKLDNPDWTGRLKLVTKGDKCILKIEDKTSGQLFAKCPIDAYPGPAVEPVSDSSRYFVIRVQDDNGRSAFIGMGFADRGDSFDFNVALQDHFKLIEKQNKLEQEDSNDTQPKLDLKFKEGETIKVNLNIAKKPGSGSGKNKSKVSGAPGILLPPPGGIKLPAPPGNNTKPESNEFSSPVSLLDTVGEETKAPPASSKQELNDLFDDFDTLSLSRLKDEKSDNSSTNLGQTATFIDSSNSSDLWANFGAASANSLPLSSNQQQPSQNWANF